MAPAAGDCQCTTKDPSSRLIEFQPCTRSFRQPTDLGAHPKTTKRQKKHIDQRVAFPAISARIGNLLKVSVRVANERNCQGGTPSRKGLGTPFPQIRGVLFKIPRNHWTDPANVRLPRDTSRSEWRTTLSDPPHRELLFIVLVILSKIFFKTELAIQLR
jgi:hypothetical protein